MYQQFFQFRRLPFQLTPDPHFFFFTARHEEAFNQALYGVKERKGFMVLTGEVGTGKTTLSRLLIEHLGARVKSSLLFNPNLTTVELLQAINHDFGIADQSYSKKLLTDELNRFLLEQLMQGGNALLVVDEAQTLPIECLEEIRLLSNLETPRAKLLQILLVGQPELNDKLALPQLRQLSQRITLRAELAPLTSQEIADYIQYRLWRAGGRETVHFEPPAVELVSRYSQGVPRLVNALCDRALLAAYVRGTRRISGFVMGQAIGELTPMLSVAEPPPFYLTKEEPAPRPELRRRTGAGADTTLRMAFIGLCALVVGLLMMWWKSGSIDERFPMALLASDAPVMERTDPLPPALDLWAPPLPLTPALPEPEPAAGVPIPYAPIASLPPVVQEAAPAEPVVEITEAIESEQGAPPVPSGGQAAAPVSPPKETPIVASDLPPGPRLPFFPSEVVGVSLPSASSGGQAPAPAQPELPAATDRAAQTTVARTFVEPPAPALDLTVPSTADGQAPAAGWYLDAEGVIRTGMPELLERAAVTMLLHQWNAAAEWPPYRLMDPAEGDPASVAREQRLESLKLSLPLHELVKLDYPAIVYRLGREPGQTPAPVVISRASATEVTLLDPRNGLVRRPVDQLAKELVGPVWLYWRPLNDWRWPGPVDGADPVIGWLQRRLREERFYEGPVDGLLGPGTERALQQLARQRGLIITTTHPLMELLISQLLKAAEFPRLTVPLLPGKPGAPASAGTEQAGTEQPISALPAG